MKRSKTILKRTSKFDLICHECDTELDHHKLKWRQKKSIEFDDKIDNKRHLLSIPTCTKAATDRLMEIESEVMKIKEEIKNGKDPQSYNMLLYILQNQSKDTLGSAYLIYLSANFIKFPKGKKRDPEGELPYMTFGTYEFVYVSDCPNCGSLLETPWRGADSIKATKWPGKSNAKPDIAKCHRCNNSIEYREQFWYIYFTKHERDRYNANIVTICQRCKFEHHQKSGHNLALRFTG